MKKQLIVVGIMLVLLTIGLSGCSEENDGKNIKVSLINPAKSDEEKIVGNWICKGKTITFTDDGVLYLVDDRIKCNYWFENGYINTSCPKPYEVGIFKYTFENDDTLVLEIRDKSHVYIRVK